MCEECDCEDTKPFDVIKPQETDVLLKVFNKMKAVNPNAWFGSGVVIDIKNLKGQDFLPPFLFSGDFMGELADLVKRNIAEQFKLRRVLMLSDLEKMEQAIEATE